MQIKVKLPWLICIMLGLIMVWLFYQMMDQAVTLDHQTQYTTTIVEQRNILVHVLNATGTDEPESKVRELLAQFAGDSSFQKGSNEVVADQVSFYFKDGHLDRVAVEAEDAH